MKSIFINSDVILDVFAQREPFYTDSAKLLSLAEKRNVKAFTSPIVVTNIFYILRKLTTRENALESLRKLRLFIKILSVTELHVDSALSSRFKDFENAIQHFASVDHNVRFIVTRNKPDYKHSIIAVCTPTEFLEIYNSQKKAV